MRHTDPAQFRTLSRDVQWLLEDFLKARAENVRRYKTAQYRPDRDSARGRVLHYGRLIRKIERSAS
ncbi:hypothetical protein [Sulfitobacter sp. 20_GPM-1509m]|uniref:hypothetical protein n=1 Tax=Sulfitobacter sp. 20_GPM-1509m TaxID=1380367 RepID=UPI00048A4D56|nr:hypothetical protein [Sulfitobacter sp. 20_GPM-1509m]